MEYVDAVGAWLLNFFVWIWSFWQTQFLLAHIGANVVVAVAVSIYTGQFVLAKTGEFLYKKVLPFVLVFAFCAALGEAAGLQWLMVAAWAGLELMLFGDLADNLSKLGIKIPDSLTKNRLDP